MRRLACLTHSASRVDLNFNIEASEFVFEHESLKGLKKTIETILSDFKNEIKRKPHPNLTSQRIIQILAKLAYL